MARFDDRIVLITGAGSGIGKASAEKIAGEGGTVACVDFNEEAVQQVVESIVASGGEACALTCDASDHESVKTTVATVVEKYGKIKIPAASYLASLDSAARSGVSSLTRSLRIASTFI